MEEIKASTAPETEKATADEECTPVTQASEQTAEQASDGAYSGDNYAKDSEIVLECSSLSKNYGTL